MSVNSIEPLIRSAKTEDEISAEGGVTKTVKLTRTSSGYGMYLREICPVEKIESFIPTDTKPSTQLIIDCDEGGAAAKAGLIAGDFIVEVNNEDVRRMKHANLLKLIGSLKKEVVLKVVHVPKYRLLSFEARKLKSEKEEGTRVGDKPATRRGKADIASPEPVDHNHLSAIKPSGGGGPSPSARRRRIKVLPDADGQKLGEVVEIGNQGTDNSAKKKDFAKAAQPFRLLPIDCDATTIWEQAKAMQAKRRSSSKSDDDSFLPDSAPHKRDHDATLKMVKDHPYKWGVLQTSQWVAGLGLPLVSSLFLDNEIKGEHLKYISKDDLKSIGVTEKGVLSQLAHEIASLLMEYDSGGHV